MTRKKKVRRTKLKAREHGPKVGKRALRRRREARSEQRTLEARKEMMQGFWRT